ncbi:MAG: ABC transporter ATP-binding protein [Candidatus Thermoplasmatota archaeon]|nr:ABC transporter ATP-binding protein [Candidatus Thermoplasmatota archaeon]MCL5983279.1 ABC transporter ATP-binding protein [Candidatus Thermoplasmatota archaeon]
MADAIVVEGLTKNYGSLAAVDNISFRVPPGSVFAFLGPNGAGKTTTTEILEGLRARSKGSVRVLGLDPWGEGRPLHRQIGVIPQDFRFFEKITPRESIDYYSTLFGTHPDPAALLERVKLSDKANSRFDTLSGGQKQKLGLALSLVNDPRICFLDEPTTGLDPTARRAIWDVVRELRREGRTVFLTTHYLEEAEILADRVAIINHGQIVAAGSPAEIIDRLGGPARLRIVAGSDVADFVRSRFPNEVRREGDHIDVVLRDREDALAILEAVQASRLAWTGFTTVRDTLEDVFVRLVGRMDDGVLKSSDGTAAGAST